MDNANLLKKPEKIFNESTPLTVTNVDINSPNSEPTNDDLTCFDIFKSQFTEEKSIPAVYFTAGLTILFIDGAVTLATDALPLVASVAFAAAGVAAAATGAVIYGIEQNNLPLPDEYLV